MVCSWLDRIVESRSLFADGRTFLSFVDAPRMTGRDTTRLFLFKWRSIAVDETIGVGIIPVTAAIKVVIRWIGTIWGKRRWTRTLAWSLSVRCFGTETFAPVVQGIRSFA